MNLKPTNDLVLIRRITNESPKTASGIILPPVEESQDTPWRGTVLAVGPGKPAKLSPAGQEIVVALEQLARAAYSSGIAVDFLMTAKLALNNHANATPRMPMQVKVGDTVIFSRNGYQEFKLDGEVLLGMGEASILGILE